MIRSPTGYHLRLSSHTGYYWTRNSQLCALKFLYMYSVIHLDGLLLFCAYRTANWIQLLDVIVSPF